MAQALLRRKRGAGGAFTRQVRRALATLRTADGRAADLAPLLRLVLNRTRPAHRTDGFHSPSPKLEAALRPRRRGLAAPPKASSAAPVAAEVPAGCRVRFFERDDETYVMAGGVGTRNRWS